MPGARGGGERRRRRRKKRGRGSEPHRPKTPLCITAGRGRSNNTCRGIQRSFLATSEIVQQHNFLMMGNDETSISNLFFCLVPGAAASGSAQAQAPGARIPVDGASACWCLPWISRRSSKLKIASKWAQLDCFNASRENTRNVEILEQEQHGGAWCCALLVFVFLYSSRPFGGSSGAPHLKAGMKCHLSQPSHLQNTGTGVSLLCPAVL